ncbi:unnamed protein product [Hyaloperonospora brassicae]|uniref:Myb-like domain-containing protein n=1 Tax=Hyaloperonospora brassicae TaxID=162125 RepID=A0AAV0UV44_HYABA|nr:unnamed protein product [Hyaloperonospora brassicae]
MASASRVPLLVKSKGRRSSRVSIAPRARPSHGPRANRIAAADDGKVLEVDGPMLKVPETDVAARKCPDRRAKVVSIASTSTVESVELSIAEDRGADLKCASSIESVTVSTTVVKSKRAGKGAAIATISASTATVRSSGVQTRRAGEIAVGGSLSATLPSNSASAGLHTEQKATVLPPSVLPVQRRDERLAKITSAGPVYQASPVMRPRAGSIGMPPTGRSRGVSLGSSPSEGPQKSLPHRLVRKLEVKPHQSPRRSAMQGQQEGLRKAGESASPLILGSKSLKEVPDMHLDAQQSQSEPSAKTTRAQAVRATKRLGKRRHADENASVETSGTTSVSRRRSLERKVKRSTYRETGGSSNSESEPDDDRDEDVNPDDLDLPEEATKIYVPARERATMWAKSILRKDEDDKKGRDTEDADASRAIVLRAQNSAGRKKPNNTKASSVSSADRGIGSGMMSRNEMEKLMKKEPSEMTMGELALTVPKGRRTQLHEREEAAVDTSQPADLSGRETSDLINMDALDHVHSLSVSSESAAFAGSLVTPQVRIIDGQMVVLENTIKLGDELQRTDSLGENRVGGGTSGLPPRHSGSRYKSAHSKGPGKRWGQEETKQFYYCLSQVGPNFSMMATLFPTRKRKELKSKFKHEERNHAKLIEIALRASAAPLDSEMVDVISQMVDREAQQKQGTLNRKRKSSLQLHSGQNDDTASVSTPMTLSPMSTPHVDTEEFVETLNDEDLFPSNRHDSFDFSG